MKDLEDEKMKLSDIALDDAMLIRDGEFSRIGLTNDVGEEILTSVETRHDLQSVLLRSDITCVIADEEFAKSVPGHIGVIVCGSPLETLLKVHNSLVESGEFYPAPEENDIDHSAVIHPTATIDSKGVTIGANCVVCPRAVLLEGTILDEDVVVGPGTVVGCSSGASYNDGKTLVPVVSVGRVHIARKVEVHACGVIAKAVFGGKTTIGEFTMLDNLVTVGAGARIGRRCFLPACATVGGNAVIGDDVWIGPNSVIAKGVEVGDGASVTIGSVVVADVPPRGKVTGNFAIDHDIFIQFMKKIR